MAFCQIEPNDKKIRKKIMKLKKIIRNYLGRYISFSSILAQKGEFEHVDQNNSKNGSCTDYNGHCSLALAGGCC